jgi:predicted Zn-dependent protease
LNFGIKLACELIGRIKMIMILNWNLNRYRAVKCPAEGRGHLGFALLPCWWCPLFFFFLLSSLNCTTHKINEQIEPNLTHKYEDVETLYTQGLFYYYSGAYQQATNSLFPAFALAQGQDLVDISYLLGYIAMELDNPTLALMCVQKGLEVEPLSSKLRILMAKIYIQAGDVQSANDFIEDLPPDQKDVLIISAEILNVSNQPDSAKKILFGLLENYPEDTEVLKTLAWIMLDEGNLISAYDYFRIAYRHCEYDLSLLKGLAQVTRRLGLELESINYLKKVIDNNPDFINPRIELVDLYLWQGQYDEANRLVFWTTEKSAGINLELLSIIQQDYKIQNRYQELKDLMDELAQFFNSKDELTSMVVNQIYADIYLNSKEYGKADSLMNELKASFKNKNQIYYKLALSKA